MKHFSVRNNYRVLQLDHSKRIFWTIIFFIGLTLLLVYRLFQLQIVSGQSMYNKSLDNQYTFASLQPQRGQILDRNGVILAKNIPQFHLDIIVESQKKSQKTLDDLHRILQLDEHTYARAQQSISKTQKHSYVRVISRLSQSQLNLIYSKNLHLHPLRITPEFIRFYPKSQLSSSVTGYVLSKKIAKDKKSNNPNILATYSGADGIEKNYDQVLSGSSGVAQLQRDAKGAILKTVSNIPAQNGADIVLTIDTKLQEIIHRKMQGKRGAVIITNPSNGEILGFYSAPSYNPNAFLDPGLSAQLKDYFQSAEKPLFNRVLAGQFPPASTVKPFLALYALDDKIIDKKFSIYDTGSFQYKKTANIYRNWNRQGHGHVDTKRAIIVSNDTFFYQLALKTGIDRMSSVYSAYGFGKLTGIDLPGEKKGLLPTRLWKKQQGASWLIGDTIITGIGQGSLLVTPLQMAYATNVLATRGHAPTLHVVQSIKHADQLTEQPKYSAAPSSALSFKHWDYVVSAMQKVVQYGTGRQFGHHNVPIAAKTGTAQLVKNSGRAHKIKSLSDHSWFIGFVVKDKPDFSITVLVENENDAIIVAREIVNDYFDTL